VLHFIFEPAQLALEELILYVCLMSAFRPRLIGVKAARGVAWLMVETVLGRGVSLISQLVLAKLLMPEDFGILGLAMTISSVFGLLLNCGVDQVLQQRPNKKRRYWATQTFWISLLVATLTAVVMALYAPFGAKLYGNEKIAGLVWVLALGFPFQALVTVPQVNLQAQLKFKFLASYNTAEAFMAQALTVLLAWLGLGALSFVIPISVLAAVRSLVFWRLAPIPLLPWRKAKGWVKMGVRSATILGGEISLTLIEQGDYITLGLLAPLNVVGAYFFAFKLAVQPMSLLARNFRNVLFPVLVALDGEPQRQRDVAFRASSFLGLLTTPLCLAMAAIAEPLLTVLFGDRWSASIPYVQILSLGLALDALAWPAGWLLGVRGLFFRTTVYLAISAVFFFILVGTGGLLGSARGVAIAVAIYYVIHSTTFTSLVFMQEGIGARQIILSFAVPYLLSILSLGPAHLLSRAPVLQGHYVAQMAVTLSLGGLIYVGSLRLFLPDFYQDTMSRLRGMLQRKL